MAKHDWLPGGYGHGTTHCRYCGCTEREAAFALGQECPKAPALDHEAENIRLRAALTLALDYLGQLEPGDSRAVSNEYVAMSAVLCRIEPSSPNSELRIICDALDARQNPHATIIRTELGLDKDAT